METINIKNARVNIQATSDKKELTINSSLSFKPSNPVFSGGALLQKVHGRPIEAKSL